MTLNKALQKPEESVRRPQTLDDAVLLGLVSNALRQVLAEVSSITLVDTLNAVVSQIRQMMHGTAAGHWSDIPAITLDALAELRKLRVSTYYIPPGGSLVIDTNVMADFTSTKYFVEFSNTAGPQRGSFEVAAAKDGVGVSDSICSILGFRFAAIVNFHVVAADAALEVTNNEAFTLKVKLTKLSD